LSVVQVGWNAHMRMYDYYAPLPTMRVRAAAASISVLLPAMPDQTLFGSNRNWVLGVAAGARRLRVRTNERREQVHQSASRRVRGLRGPNPEGQSDLPSLRQPSVREPGPSVCGYVRRKQCGHGEQGAPNARRGAVKAHGSASFGYSRGPAKALRRGSRVRRDANADTGHSRKKSLEARVARAEAI
jgi:hypothetical protein